ncbi:MAG: redoxin domain-containing protein [Planctomycetia bacterium]
MCSLRDSEEGFRTRKVARFGISLDDVAAQKAFHTAQRLDYALLSDPDGSVARRYRVLPEGAGWTQRVTFVVDPQGVVRHVDRNVAVGTHGADLLPVLDRLQAEAR